MLVSLSQPVGCDIEKDILAGGHSYLGEKASRAGASQGRGWKDSKMMERGKHRTTKDAQQVANQFPH